MIKTIRNNPKLSVYLLGLLVAIAATAIETFRLRYANYLVYSDSTIDFWNGVNPYTQEFVDSHGRYYLYTPVFSVLFTPIAFLPKWLGPFVWNLCNYTLFALSVFTLPKRYDAYKILGSAADNDFGDYQGVWYSRAAYFILLSKDIQEIRLCGGDWRCSTYVTSFKDRD